MRETIAEALKQATKNQEKKRVCTVRLIMAAIKDRDIANRSAGKDPVSDDEILQILAKMVKQRQESAKTYEEAHRLELAEQERGEIEIIREFMPKQLCEEDTKRAVADVIDEIKADGLRDVGRCMNTLKQRFSGRMDFGKASGIAKTMLR